MKTYVIALCALAPLLVSTDASASKIKNIDWRMTVEDYSTNVEYDISVTPAGGSIPMTRNLCVQLPHELATADLNGQLTRYHVVTALCMVGKTDVSVVTYCHTQFKNNNESFAYFKLNEGSFKLIIRCEYK